MVDSSVMMERITFLAIARQKPLIIIENPKLQRGRSQMDQMSQNNGEWVFKYIAGIGDVYVGFDNYEVSSLVDLYAELVAGLAVEKYAKDTKQVNNNAPYTGADKA